MIGSGKHSSLLRYGNNYCHKKFYSTGPWFSTQTFGFNLVIQGVSILNNFFHHSRRGQNVLTKLAPFHLLMRMHDGTSLVQKLAENKSLVGQRQRKKSFTTHGQNSNTCYISATYVLAPQISFFIHFCKTCLNLRQLSTFLGFTFWLLRCDKYFKNITIVNGTSGANVIKLFTAVIYEFS